MPEKTRKIAQRDKAPSSPAGSRKLVSIIAYENTAADFRENRVAKLAVLFTKLTSSKLANREVTDDEELYGLQLMAGLTLNRPAMQAAGSIKPASVVQRSSRLPIARQLATQLRGKFREAWRAPPCLTA